MPGASQFIILSMSEENINEGSKYHQCNSPINILSGRCKVANDLLTLTFRDESEQQLTSDTRRKELERVFRCAIRIITLLKLKAFGFL
jgi:hypothetical protein